MYALGNKVKSFIDSYRSGREVKFGKEFTYSNKDYYFNSENRN